MTRLIISDPMPDEMDQTPYDSSVDAHGRWAGAFTRAESNAKPVLINFGANWCPDARAFCAMLTLPGLHDYLHANYEVLTLDVGRYDLNMDLVARAGLDEGLEGVPTIVILSPDGQVLNPDRISQWRTARQASPQDVADFLVEFSKP